MLRARQRAKARNESSAILLRVTGQTSTTAASNSSHRHALYAAFKRGYITERFVCKTFRCTAMSLHKKASTYPRENTATVYFSRRRSSERAESSRCHCHWEAWPQSPINKPPPSLDAKILQPPPPAWQERPRSSLGGHDHLTFFGAEAVRAADRLQRFSDTRLR